MIALVLALASATIGVAVAIDWRSRPFLAMAIVIGLAYWVLGQGLGGIFTGTATDPGSGASPDPPDDRGGLPHAGSAPDPWRRYATRVAIATTHGAPAHSTLSLPRIGIDALKIEGASR